MRFDGLVERYIVRKGRTPQDGQPGTTGQSAGIQHRIGSFQSPQRQPERMAADLSKHLDRPKRFLEKNLVEDAIQAYLALLHEMPPHQESTQALRRLIARLD